MASSALAFLMPLGIALVLWGGMPEGRARSAAARVLAALGLATLGYWLSGFALQYGGIGCLHDLPGLGALDRPLTLLGGPGGSWGIAGQSGWLLAVPADALDGVLRLFLGQLPLLLALGVVGGLSLIGRERGVGSWLAIVLLAALLGPLVGGWAWAGGPSAAQPFMCPRPDNPAVFDVNYGGWLGNLGLTLGWGHGFVDFAGSGTVHLLAAAVALAAIVTFGPRTAPMPEGEPVEMPPVHLPLLAVLGLALWYGGWLAWPLAHPLYTGIPWPVYALNGLLALGAGTLAAQLYAAATTGRADVLMAVRGGAAGLVAISASAPFVPFWGAALIGLIAGALVPVVQYAVEHVWRREDLTAALAVHGVGGLWGLLALGILASGWSGVGWNALGAHDYLGMASQGVSGLIVAPGLVSDLGQIRAQLIGAMVILVTGFVPALALFQLVNAPARLAAVASTPAPVSEAEEQKSIRVEPAAEVASVTAEPLVQETQVEAEARAEEEAKAVMVEEGGHEG
jgi:Amt family ammonium transporter